MFEMTGATVARIAGDDPELGAALVMDLLPVLDLPIGGRLSVAGAGAWGSGSYEASTDARGLAELIAGRSPMQMMLRGRLRVRGSRRKIGGLAALTSIVGANVRTADYRVLPWVVDPAVTRGYHFTVGYDDGDDIWFVGVRDGRPLTVTTSPPEDGPDAMVRGTDIVGELHPASLLERWIRHDEAELRRAEAQRVIQAARVDSVDAEFARWERERWSATKVDLAVDREQWLALSSERQQEFTRYFAHAFVEAERIDWQLPPTLEAELLQATRLATRAQALTFLDRFAGEVMALEPGDMRGRLDMMRAVEAVTGVVQWLERHSLFPGLAAGLAMIDRATADEVGILRPLCVQGPALFAD
jgi:hypothetical protein